MDKLWRQEAEREMTRRFTTPLLPLKLSTARLPTARSQSSSTSHLNQPHSRIVPSSINRSTPIPAPRQQVLGAHHQQSSDGAPGSRKKTSTARPDRAPRISQSPASTDSSPKATRHGNNDGRQTGEQGKRDRKMKSELSKQNSDYESMPRDVQKKVAISAAALEESLPHYFGRRRKDLAVHFREQPEFMI